MLTGDAVAIAKETCRQLNLGMLPPSTMHFRFLRYMTGTNVYDSHRLMGGNMAGSDVCILLVLVMSFVLNGSFKGP